MIKRIEKDMKCMLIRWDMKVDGGYLNYWISVILKVINRMNNILLVLS